MSKPRVVLLTVAVLASAAAIISFLILRDNHAARMEIAPRKLDEFDTMLRALIVPFPAGRLTESDRKELARRRTEHREAEEKLRQIGTNVLPRLMEEVREVGRVEATNRNAALEPTRRLARAFEVLGSDARPLLPMLIEELHGGRSVGPSMAGIVSIGGTDAGFALVPGLTNSDPVIRNWTMSAVSSFRTNHEVALAAVPLLLLHLNDKSEFSRALAASVVGSMRVKPETAIPALLEIAKHDPDDVVRRQAIKAIGRFATDAISAKPSLEILAATDENVSRIATVAIQAIEGKIAPVEVQ